MATFPTALLYLPASSGGLGLPRFLPYINTCKWSMAHQAITSGTDAAEAANELQRGGPHTRCTHGHWAGKPYALLVGAVSASMQAHPIQ